jgi:hypothetical protein
MERDKIKIYGAQILISLFEKHKNQTWILSSSEIESKKKAWFPGKWGEYCFSQYKHKFGLKCGITLSEDNSVFFLTDDNKSLSRKFQTLEDIRETFHIHNSNSIKINVWTDCFIKMSEHEIQFLQEFLNIFSSMADKRVEFKENQLKVSIETAEFHVESFKKSQVSFLEEFDKDGNGIIDIVEGDDAFMTLLKKHQKKIIDIDKEYIQNLVKVSNYLKTKRQNIQNLYFSIKNTIISIIVIDVIERHTR